MDNQKEPTPREKLVPDNYSNKLLEFQKRVAAIPKDATNPFFHSKYFNVNTVIEVIKPILSEVGLVVLQPLRVENGKNILNTEIWDENHCIRNSDVLIPEITDIQKFGAALTYLRRYALVSLLLLQGEEDDDGNSATKAPVKQNSASSKPSSPKPTSPSSTMSNGANTGEMPATAKQKDFIKTLMKANHIEKLSEAGIKPGDMTIGYAKEVIDQLLKLKDELPTIQVE